MSKRRIKKDTIKYEVIQVVSEIPFGRTISYAELAERVGMKGKIRYVATFLKQNPYPIAIPCHRVIRKNGSYGNYLLGKEFKKYLIEWEKKLTED